MMFRSAVSDLVDSRIQRRGGIRFWIHGTRPTRKSRLIAVSRQEKDERKRNLDTKKNLIWATISTWLNGPWAVPLYPRVSPPCVVYMARGSI
ncbi:hypothetical protein CGRA01v4_01893 [Colletotrichum graminicola]|nr:hypothetical protein CGRA01v4_01893 [Colletotrichum graminicola]